MNLKPTVGSSPPGDSGDGGRECIVFSDSAMHPCARERTKSYGKNQNVKCI